TVAKSVRSVLRHHVTWRANTVTWWADTGRDGGFYAVRVARQQNPDPEPGLVVADKPGGKTSHDVVARVRRSMGTRKVGHAGTLDTMATGIRVLGIGRATKLLGHLSLDRKTYLARMVLGAATVTEDVEGETLSTAAPDDVAAVTEAEVTAAIASWIGQVQQVPSAVSAVKVDGKRAYERV